MSVDLEVLKRLQSVTLQLLKTPGMLMQIQFLELDAVKFGINADMLSEILNDLIKRGWATEVKSSRTGLVFAYRITRNGARAKSRLLKRLDATRVATS